MAVLLSYFLLNRYISSDAAPLATTMPEARLTPGTKLPLGVVDWTKKERNLLMVLSSTCRFCTESTTFYQRLIKQNAVADKFNVLAVLPQDISESTKYLSDNGVAVDDLIKAAPSEVLVRGTPTLILTDRKGIVLESWSGKLPPEAELKILAKLFD